LRRISRGARALLLTGEGEETHVREHAIRLRILGGFRLLVDGRPAVVPIQAQRLLGLLAVRPCETRTAAAGLLWGDVTQERAQANLRNAAWRLNAVSDRILAASRCSIALGPAVSLDLADARSAARALANGELVDAAALDLLAEDLLPGWDEDWLVIERERQRQVRLHAVEALSRLLRERGRHGEAVAAALTAVGAEPLRESAQRVLVEAHIAEGNVSEAVRQARSYRELLRLELGIAPSHDFEALVPRRPLAPARATPARAAALRR
jgi:DNA-binding SARP family transcriptional activator